MSKKNRRLVYLLILLLMSGTGITFILYGLKNHIVYFVTPSDPITPKTFVRLGGMVKKGSLVRSTDGAHFSFIVTDGKADLKVSYTGLVPDLFREEQGVVAEGKLNNTVFQATRILAKHDENYMPREVTKALEEKGYKVPQVSSSSTIASTQTK